ncbi:hypothetical protein ABZX30_02365 [Streptomyces sp. NPDC004542]|uniref:hypothetical protein n=1 Tax=Streptomyces sp. NPDC004542 TaxID=3154281 RepID=UPI0033AA3A0C
MRASSSASTSWAGHATAPAAATGTGDPRHVVDSAVIVRATPVVVTGRAEAQAYDDRAGAVAAVPWTSSRELAGGDLTGNRVTALGRTSGPTPASWRDGQRPP